MRQSTAVVLTMMAAFLVFVTVRGELPAYLNVLFGPVPAAGASSSTTATATSAASSASGLLSGVSSILTGGASAGLFGGGGSTDFGGGGDITTALPGN